MAYDMCAGKVTIDLLELKQTLAGAVAFARNELSRRLDKIYEECRDAYSAEFNKQNEDHFRYLCHANTGKSDMVDAAKHYAGTIEAYFHVCEAIKREEVVCIKGTK